jgi:CheY-like chemotaxis protein
MSLILIVDDIRTLADQYAYDLKRIGGHETRVATSGQAALDMMARDAIDCVILDLEMPGMDGFEVLRRMQKDGIEIPVIVYTGTGDFDRCAQAIRLGAASFIDKGESMERVAHEVETAIERARLRDEVTALRRDLGAEHAGRISAAMRAWAASQRSPSSPAALTGGAALARSWSRESSPPGRASTHHRRHQHGAAGISWRANCWSEGAFTAPAAPTAAHSPSARPAARSSWTRLANPSP